MQYQQQQQQQYQQQQHYQQHHLQQQQLLQQQQQQQFPTYSQQPIFMQSAKSSQSKVIVPGLVPYTAPASAAQGTWVEALAASGVKYWYNSITHESTWTNPTKH